LRATLLVTLWACAPAPEATVDTAGPFTGPTTDWTWGTTPTPTETTSTPTPTRPPECDALSTGGLTYTVIDIFTEEDFDFDLRGYLVYQSGTNVAGRHYDGHVSILSTGVSSDAAGIQVLQNGDIAVAAPDTGTIKYIDRDTGANHAIIAGLSFPNAIESGEGPLVYFSEMNADRIGWVDPLTEESGTVTTGLSSPNGIVLSPDANTLYVAGSHSGIDGIAAVDRTDTGWSAPRTIVSSSADFDGLETDVCGNVYSVNAATGELIRFDPVTGANVQLVDIAESGYFSSLKWGNGIGTWATDTLYVTNRNKVFAIPVGIDGTPDPVDPDATTGG